MRSVLNFSAQFCDKSDFAIWYRCYRSVVCLSVTFMHRAQTAKDIDTIAPCLCQIVLKFCFHRSTSLILRKFCPKVATPLYLSAEDIGWEIVAEW